MKTKLLELCNRTGRIYVVLEPKFEIDRTVVYQQFIEHFDEFNVCLFPDTLEEQLQNLIDSEAMTKQELQFLKRQVGLRRGQPSKVLAQSIERFLAFEPVGLIKKFFSR